jgi:hypothetical protein
MVRDQENLSSVLDSAPQKSINLNKMFKKFSTTVKMQPCVFDINNSNFYSRVLRQLSLFFLEVATLHQV